MRFEEKHKNFLHLGLDTFYRFFFLAPKPIRHILIFELIWIFLIFGSGQGTEIFTFAFETYMVKSTFSKVIYFILMYLGFYLLTYFINMQCRWMYEKERLDDDLVKEQGRNFGYSKIKTNSALDRLVLRRKYEEVHIIFWAILPVFLFVFKYITQIGFANSFIHIILLLILAVVLLVLLWRKRMDPEEFADIIAKQEAEREKKLQEEKSSSEVLKTQLKAAQFKGFTSSFKVVGSVKDPAINFYADSQSIIEQRSKKDLREVTAFQKLTRKFYTRHAHIRRNLSDYFVLGVSIILAMVYLIWPNSNFLGPLTISFVGIMFLSMIVTGLSYLLSKVDIPTFIIVAGWIVFCSFFNNNHTLRTVKVDERISTKVKSPFITSHFQEWLERKLDSSEFLKGHSIEKPAPVYVLASEGGGIRSAYWTVGLLEILNTQYPDLFSNTYALSGVSGGSIGLATFNAYYKDHFIDNDPEALLSEVSNSTEEIDESFESTFISAYYTKASRVLGEDYLTPLLTGLLFPDLLQRVLPFCVPKLDRARLIENSWEKNYRVETGYKTLKGGMNSLWEGEAKWQLPNLFFNTTRVETGEKVVISNLSLDKAFFPRTIDLQKRTNQEFLLKSAAFASARFPLITPVARIDDANGKTWGNIVDGGYFDNTGLHTALEIVDMMKAVIPDSLPIKPVIVAIRNSRDRTGDFPAQRGLHESLSPLKSFYNSWGARANYFAVDMKGLSDELDFEYLLFNLPFVKDSIDLGFPLGWTLSESTRKNMDEMVDKVISEGDNYFNFLRLGKLEE